MPQTSRSEIMPPKPPLVSTVGVPQFRESRDQSVMLNEALIITGHGLHTWSHSSAVV